MENVESSIRNHDLSTLAVDLTALNFEEKLCHISTDFDAKISAISSEVKHDLQHFQDEMRGLCEDLIHAVRESLEGSLKEIISTQLESFQGLCFH